MLTGGTAVAEDVLRTIGAKYYANLRAKSQKGNSYSSPAFCIQNDIHKVHVQYD